jgi:VWFA-related protein
VVKKSGSADVENAGRWRAAIAILATAMLVPVCAGMAQQTAIQDGEIPVIRSSTRLVDLNVVVRDRQRRPVSNLLQSDFQVFDNGVPQRIVHFSGTSRPAPGSPKPSLVVSNREGNVEQPPGVTVILMDELILDSPGVVPLDMTAPIRQARLAVLSFLGTIKPGTQVALYALRREGIVVLHDFTDDQAALFAAARSLGGGGPRGRSINLDDMQLQADSSLRGWRQNAPAPASGPATYRAGVEANRLLRGYGFQAIAHRLEGVSGRKNLVWISSTLPMSVTDFDVASMGNGRDANMMPTASLANPAPTPHHPQQEGHLEELRDFARWLSDADIAVYPIDAWGLGTGGSNVAQWSAADMIASETGGRAIFNSNRIDEHLQEIVAEGSTSYQIGYYPGDNAWDGKYHHIEVRLARKGMTPLFRHGYWAADHPETRNADLALHEVARSVVDAPRIGIALKVTSNPLKSGPEDVVLRINVRDLHFERKDDRSKAYLDVAFVQLGKDGRVLDEFKDRVALALPPHMYEAAETNGWFYPRSLRINAEAEKMRIVARDLMTGAVGSVSVPVEFEPAR